MSEATVFSCPNGFTDSFLMRLTFDPIKLFAFRTGITPGGSRGNSKPNSRPLSASGSRHGSNLSLNSNGEFQSRQRVSSSLMKISSTPDDGTQTRIPTRRVTTSTPSRPQRLSVGSASATKTNGSTRTPSGSASPAPTR